MARNGSRSSTRRKFLRTGSGIAAIALAGCIGRSAIPGPGDFRADAYRSNGGTPESVALSSGSWPQFGATPQNTGHAKNASGPGPGEPELAWRHDAGTPTMNTSPVVGDGRVFVAGSGGTGRIVALDVETGEQIWEFEPAGFATSSLALREDVLYVGTWGTQFYAIDAESGEPKWEKAIGHRFGSSSPVVAEGTVYVGTIGGGPLEVGSGTEPESDGPAFLALDADSGELQWAYRRFEERTNIDSSPAYADGVVYFTVANSVYARDAATGAELWTRYLPTHPDSSAAVADGVLYYGAPVDEFLAPPARVWALDASTGYLRWRAPINDTNLRTSPAVADGRVYVAASSRRTCVLVGGEHDSNCSGETRGRLYALDANDGSRAWRANIETDTRSSPAVADGVIYVGCDDGLSAVTVEGENAWRHSFENAEDSLYVDSSPAIGDGNVFVGASDGRLRAIRSADAG